MVKKEDISEEEPVTQEKDTKSQLLKRKRSRSGVTEDEVGHTWSWSQTQTTPSVHMDCFSINILELIYRTAGNIGGQLNLAVWRLGK